MTIAETLRTYKTLLSVPKAAEIIGLDKLTLYNRIKAKKFPVVRFGPASIRIDPSTLADWLDSCTC